MVVKTTVGEKLSTPADPNTSPGDPDYSSSKGSFSLDDNHELRHRVWELESEKPIREVEASWNRWGYYFLGRGLARPYMCGLSFTLCGSSDRFELGGSSVQAAMSVSLPLRGVSMESFQDVFLGAFTRIAEYGARILDLRDQNLGSKYGEAADTPILQRNCSKS
ncbi:hypothetical protein ACFE04_001063 [Oxalis oulophora]